MPQDQQSGAVGNTFGRDTARTIAAVLGATMAGGASNEARLDGRRIVIKCARARTPSIGVTFRMLAQIEVILGAFEQADGSFEIVELSPAVFKLLMQPTRSKGPSAGRVGVVGRAAFLAHGTRLRTVRLP